VVPVPEGRPLRRFVRSRKFVAAPLLVLAGALLLVNLRADALPQSPPLPLSQPASLPAGWKAVSYQSVVFAVPGTWPVHDLTADPSRCALLDVHAAYLGHQGIDAACPARALGRTEALQIEALDATAAETAALATAPATIGGEAARVDPSSATTQLFVVALPQTGVLLRVAWGQNEALARQVLATVTVRPGAHPAATTAPGPEPQPAPDAGADTATPATVTGYFHGRGFDTCAAPSLRSMAAWRASPFQAIGIYVGGSNRACGDGNLSARWVTAARRLGWHLAPLYVGLQPPCVGQHGLAPISRNAAKAAKQGVAAGRDAARRAAVFGLGRSTPIYFDMEAYNRAVPGCSHAVLTFLSGWTAELHRHHERAGVYGSAGSTVADLVRAYNHAGFHRPDAVWFADWSGVPTLTTRFLPDWAWAGHQRIAQYRGGHLERYGGVTLNIDSDVIDTSLVGAAAGRANFQPAIGINHDGRAELFAVSRSGALRHSWRCDCPGGWSPMTTFRLRTAITGNPSVARDATGRLQLVVRTPHGALLHLWQHQPDGNWRSLVVPRVHTTASPLLFAWPDGHLEMVAPSGHRMLHAWQHAPGGPWSGWSSLGLTTAGQVTAAINADGRPELFGTTASGHLVHCWWSAYGWSGFHPLPGPSGVGGRPAPTANVDGRLEIAARTGSGPLHAWQCAGCPGGWSWSGFNAFGADLAIGNPALIRSLSGRLTLIATTATGDAMRLRQIQPGSNWEPFGSLGGPADADVAARVTSDKVIVATRSQTGSLLVGAWTATSWSGWRSLGSGF